VNKQDGTICDVGTCAVRPDSVYDVRDIARQMFEGRFSWFDRIDPLVVEGAIPEVRVFYVCGKISNSEQRTFVDCRFHFDSLEMWIGSIQVVACHRGQGVGRQLVRAAEATANALGIEEMRILPTPAAVGFWSKLGFRLAPRSARVMWKSVSSGGFAN